MSIKCLGRFFLSGRNEILLLGESHLLRVILENVELKLLKVWKNNWANFKEEADFQKICNFCPRYWKRRIARYPVAYVGVRSATTIEAKNFEDLLKTSLAKLKTISNLQEAFSENCSKSWIQKGFYCTDSRSGDANGFYAFFHEYTMLFPNSRLKTSERNLDPIFSSMHYEAWGFRGGDTQDGNFKFSNF